MISQKERCPSTKADLIAEIEALIMASHGLSTNEIMHITGKKRNEVLEAIDNIEERYSSEEHGVELKNVAGKYSFFTKVKYAKVVSKLRKKSVMDLTRSQMEVLAIIAKNQPITMKEISNFRSGLPVGQVKELLAMRLIKRKRDKSRKGNPYIYTTTDEFLKTLGISDLSVVKGKEDVSAENTKVPENVRSGIA